MCYLVGESLTIFNFHFRPPGLDLKPDPLPGQPLVRCHRLKGRGHQSLEISFRDLFVFVVFCQKFFCTFLINAFVLSINKVEIKMNKCYPPAIFSCTVPIQLLL